MGVLTYREGSRGKVVALIQKKIGCYPDGIWGKITTEALVAWQREHSLTPDGIAGPRTLAALGLSGSGEAEQSSSAVASVFGSYGITLKRSKRRIDEIVVHCTASREGQAMTVEQIRADHIRSRGWSDIGYHYVVYLDGSVHQGRNVDIIGAHAKGHNTYSIGVSYVGGLENDPRKKYAELPAKDTRTMAQKQSLLLLLRDLKKLYPKARIIGHRDVSSKDCPSFDATAEYRDL